MKFKFKSLSIPSATLVTNEFIDDFMSQANGEYVKVYLYILRYATEELSKEVIADALDLMESDVYRALSYWERCNLIVIEGDDILSDRDLVKTGSNMATEADKYYKANDVTNIQNDINIQDTVNTKNVLNTQDATNTQNIDFEEDRLIALTENTEAKLEYIPDKSQTNLEYLKNDEEFANLLYVVQKFLSKIFSQSDTETIAYLYDVLKMPSELIEHLAEMCAEKGKTSIRYMETVALDWHSKGINSVESAKEEATLYTSEVYYVMKAFGLSGRNPAGNEPKLIKKWFNEYGFTKELVAEACKKTLSAIQKPSFEYADSILTRWSEAKVKNVYDIKKLDDEHEDKIKAINSNKDKMITKSAGAANRFNNFEQRKDDLDSMVLDKINRKLKES